MNKSGKIFVAGHGGMVGSAIVNRLRREGFDNLLLRSRAELDLRDYRSVLDLFMNEEIEYVFLAAAKVGGIIANRDDPVPFIRDNLLIQSNILDAAHRTRVKKLLFLGSSCIYPKNASQPIREESLLTGELEPTNEPYAIAKIAGIKMAQAYNRQYATNFISVMPTNLYGPRDNFDLVTSHVLPALIRKMHEAKVNGWPSVEIWGTGEPYREFMHVDDLADACLYLMNHYDGQSIVNIGIGQDLSIRELAELIRSVVGYEGELQFNADYPDGTPRKLLDVGKLNGLGWRSSIPLREGIENTYQWYVSQQPQLNHAQLY
ncbi:GDP-L-fucose synthase family protein [Cohnella sp. GCM10027633]|uniref:GDP-L-fucose synthase family protein n=1 Tax=unclassified Cohnella TaxID=2636738 RepID=UPI0036338EB2